MKKRTNPGEGSTGDTGVPAQITIVEDDEGLIRLIQKRLHRLKLSTTVATSGKEAIAQTIDHPHTLLLLDYRLPDMTGKEVIESLAEKGCTVPFIVMTGHGDEKAAVEMMKLGARDYLIKEEDFLDLIPQVVKRVVDQLVTERTLAEAQERLMFTQFFTERAGDAVYWLTADGKFIFVNDAACHALGYSKDELLRLGVPDIDPSYPAGKFAEIWEVGKREKVFRLESSHRRKDGTIFPVEITANYLEYKGKAYICAIARDITERKKAEDGLRKSEEKYRDLLDMLSTGVVLEQEGEFVYANDAAAAILGYDSAEEIVGERAIERVHPEHVGIVQAVLRRMYERGEPGAKREIKLLRKDGSEVETELEARTVTYRDRRAVQVVIYDITERKQSEKALLEVNARLRILQQVTAAVHSTLDLEEVLKRITDEIVFSMGYTTALIIALNDEENIFEIKVISTRRLLPKIDKIVGFSIENFSFPVDPEINDTIKAGMQGQTIVTSNLAEIAYPLMSKRTCAALQKLRDTKNYILVPLQIEEKVVGGILISSPREKVGGEELQMIETFARAASHALKNANLHMQRKHAEEAMKESQEKLKNLFENAVIGIYQTAPDGRILMANRAMVTMLGYSSFEELSGRNLERDGFAPNYPRSMFKQRMEKDGQIVGLESAWVRKDGTTLHVRENAKAIRDDSGNTLLYEGTVEDITERKRAEREIAKSYRELLLIEEINRATLGGEPVDKIIKKVVRAFTEICNAQALTVYFYDKQKHRLVPQNVGLDERTFRRIRKLTGIDPLDYAPLLRDGYRFYEALKSGQSFIASDPKEIAALYAEYTDSGALKSLIGPVMKVLGAKVIGAIPLVSREGPLGLISFNTTTCPPKEDLDRMERFGSQVASTLVRIKAEEQLRKLSRAVEQSPALVFITDLDGRITYVNPRFSQATGYAPEEVMGKNLRILKSDETTTETDRQMWETITSGREWVGEFRNRKKNGKVYWVFVSISPIRDSEGSITHYLCIEEDITQRKEAENRMRHRLAIEEAVSLASRLLISPEGPRLNEVLKILGKAISANRAHIFQFQKDGRKMEMTYEWHDARTASLIKNMQNTDGSNWPWWKMKLQNNEDIVLGDVNDLPAEAAAERKGLEGAGVRSVLAVPIHSTGGALIGFIGFDDMEKCREWAAEDARALRVVAEMIALCWERFSAEEALRKSQKQLRELAAHLQSVREEEQTQISREIHDELGQALTGLKMDLAWIERRFQEDQAALFDKTTSMKENIDSTIQTVRRISSKLRPGILDDLGLTAAIEWEAQSFSERTGISFQLKIDPQDISPHERYSTTVFRILQEALTNVARHANATNVLINLTMRNNNLTLTVEDNGKGITESEITDSTSFGLISMRERALLLGGEVSITGVRDRGTIVMATIPFHSE